jgi:hypothetical protein
VSDTTFLVRLRPPPSAIQQVVASTVRIQGDHLIFCDSEGKLVAMFMMEIIQSYSEISTLDSAQGRRLER